MRSIYILCGAVQDGFLSFAPSLRLDWLLPAEDLATYTLASGKLILETSTIFHS